MQQGVVEASGRPAAAYHHRFPAWERRTHQLDTSFSEGSSVTSHVEDVAEAAITFRVPWRNRDGVTNGFLAPKAWIPHPQWSRAPHHKRPASADTGGLPNESKLPTSTHFSKPKCHFN